MRYSVIFCMLCAACGGSEANKAESLRYYRLGISTIEYAVQEGANGAVENLSEDCKTSDRCIDDTVGPWLKGLYALNTARQFLRVAYGTNDRGLSEKAAACAVARLRSVNALLMERGKPIPSDYSRFFLFLREFSGKQKCEIDLVR